MNIHEELRPRTLKNFAKCIQTTPTGCWQWTGTKNRVGYGLVYVSNDLRRGAHRVMWELVRGEIADGLLVCHTCDNPSCVNPNHLFLGTYKDNSHDSRHKGRNARMVGVLHGRAKLDEAAVYDIRTSREHPSVLAKRYGVSVGTINDTRAGNHWMHVDPPRWIHNIDFRRVP